MMKVGSDVTISRLVNAAFEGDVETMASLLDAGQDVDLVDPETGNTILLLAIESSQLGAVRFLLKRGANPNKSGPGGVTPLHLAVDVEVEEAKRRFDVSGEASRVATSLVTLLLEAGADPRQSNPTGETPIHWAQNSRHGEAERLMRNLADELLTAAADRDLPRLDDKLLFDVFDH
jgi:ankyrin repeat protein